LDLELPVMDGRSVLEALRSDPTTSGIPVVVLSGAPDATKVRATDNVDKTRLLDGLARVIARLRASMAEARASPAVPV
jgi:CheY-like chemotaxis protein